MYFKELVTLTIVPAKEIPIKEQIAFGYAKDGKNYHLALVDPKSKDIKIKLMHFSGAGVGSGSDAAWAANLQIQAETARTRLNQKAGEISQRERIRLLLGLDGVEGSEEWAKQFLALMDQYDDQVLRKEMSRRTYCGSPADGAELSRWPCGNASCDRHGDPIFGIRLKFQN